MHSTFPKYQVENSPNLEKMREEFSYGKYNYKIKYAMHEMQILNHKKHNTNFCDIYKYA